MNEDKYYYAVLKLQSKITIQHQNTGTEEEKEVEGMSGFLPVFDTYEEAKEHDGDGKYDIVQIKPK